MTFLDRWNGSQRIQQFGTWFRRTNSDEREHAQSQRRSVELDRPLTNYSGAFQFLQPVVNGRRSKVHQLGQVFQAPGSVLLQSLDQGEIFFV